MNIDSYRFGKIVVDGQAYTSDVIIYPDRVDADWWREKGHSLCMEDLKEVIAAKPEVLVIGTGLPGLMSVPEDVRSHLEQQDIEVIVQNTGQAWKTYNARSNNDKTVAAFHLTC